MKPSVLISALFALLPSHACNAETFELCNHLDHSVYAAIAQHDYDNDVPGSRMVKGWYTAAPGDCAHINIQDKFFYIHVRSRVGNQIQVIAPASINNADFHTPYCFNPDDRFEYHGADSKRSDCSKEEFHIWWTQDRGNRWDLR